jgi:hypothetical protein
MKGDGVHPKPPRLWGAANDSCRDPVGVFLFLATGAAMEGLNDSHRRAILLTLSRLLQGMAEMKALIGSSSTRSPVAEYDDDLSAASKTAIEESFAELQGEILAALEKLGIRLEKRRTSLRWRLQTLLGAWQISLADLGPRKLRAYGPVGKSAGAALEEVQERLERTIAKLEKFAA